MHFLLSLSLSLLPSVRPSVSPSLSLDLVYLAYVIVFSFSCHVWSQHTHTSYRERENARLPIVSRGPILVIRKYMDRIDRRTREKICLDRSGPRSTLPPAVYCRTFNSIDSFYFYLARSFRLVLLNRIE